MIRALSYAAKRYDEPLMYLAYNRTLLIPEHVTESAAFAAKLMMWGMQRMWTKA